MKAYIIPSDLLDRFEDLSARHKAGEDVRDDLHQLVADCHARRDELGMIVTMGGREILVRVKG